MTRREVSQEAACRGREAGSRARIRGAEQGKGPDMGGGGGGPRPSYSWGSGWAKSPQGEMCPKARRAPLYRKTCISACLLKGPALILQKPDLWNRCGNNYRDWPLIGMEIITRKNKIRSRYTERKNGPREETKCQAGDQPQAKWPRGQVRPSG